MCGLAGIFDPGHSQTATRLENLTRAMTGRLAHRGPDDDGIWYDPAAGMALGFRRLAIIDLSPAGHQPMASASGRYVIAFNGEIYNFTDLRRMLDKSGSGVWRGHSDTEVLLALIEREGVERALAHLDGMFAFALWDCAEQRLTLARDRFGEKPLYYGWHEGVFAFASELKSFAALPQWPPRIDPAGCAAYLRHGWLPGQQSIFAGISRLGPGQFVVIRPDSRQPRVTTYWSAPERAAAAAGRFSGDEGEAAAELERLLRLSVERRMIADVPLGAFLSGGIDSSTVAALMCAGGRAVRTFTISFPDWAGDEAPHAAEVARHLGTDHTAIPMTERDCLDLVPELATIYDEPFADASQIPTALLCRATKAHVTVALSGDGGDELFCGYPRYYGAERAWQRVDRKPAWMRGLAALAAGGLTGLDWPPLRRIRRKVEPYASMAPELLYRDALSWWTAGDGLLPDSATAAKVWQDTAQSLGNIPSLAQRFMAMDAALYLPDDLETKIDRASMAVSLEVRAPLLQPALAEFAWSLPMAMKYKAGRGKHLLRQVLYRHVPQALVDRPKQGFDPPLRDWLRGPLRDWADDLIASDDLSCGGLFDPRPVRSRWAEHRSGRRNWAFPLWVVLMLRSWYGKTFQPPGPGL
jgi:asparagine synthase (glutamine-hydrolysing)